MTETNKNFLFDLAEPHLLGDKHCPKCNSPSSIYWKSIGVTRRDSQIVEWGRYARVATVTGLLNFMNARLRGLADG